MTIPFLVMLGLMFSSAGAVLAQDDDKPTIVVGSKNFTEQILMSELVAVTLEDAGYPVERQFGLGGTAVIHQAMWNGEIDIFVEYTGTALVAVLGMDVPTGDGATSEGGDVATPVSSVADETYQIVKDEYDEQYDITWLDHFGFNNTYAMTVTQETADELDLQNTSDLEGHASDMTLGTDQEFPVREDGLPGFEEAYGFSFGDVQAGDPGLMYAALDNGDVDVITAYSTDGRIPALDLVILEDDENFFPPYYPAPVIRQEVLDQNPEIADVLNKLGGAITEDQMAELNYQVDEEGLTTEEVARTFLEEQGIIDTGE